MHTEGCGAAASLRDGIVQLQALTIDNHDVSASISLLNHLTQLARNNEQRLGLLDGVSDGGEGAFDVLASAFRNDCARLVDLTHALKEGGRDEDGIFAEAQPKAPSPPPPPSSEAEAAKAAKAKLKIPAHIDAVTCYCRLFRNLSAGCSNNQSALEKSGVLRAIVSFVSESIEESYYQLWDLNGTSESGSGCLLLRVAMQCLGNAVTAHAHNQSVIWNMVMNAAPTQAWKRTEATATATATSSSSSTSSSTTTATAGTTRISTTATTSTTSMVSLVLRQTIDRKLLAATLMLTFNCLCQHSERAVELLQQRSVLLLLLQRALSPREAADNDGGAKKDPAAEWVFLLFRHLFLREMFVDALCAVGTGSGGDKLYDLSTPYVCPSRGSNSSSSSDDADADADLHISVLVTPEQLTLLHMLLAVAEEEQRQVVAEGTGEGEVVPGFLRCCGLGEVCVLVRFLRSLAVELGVKEDAASASSSTTQTETETETETETTAEAETKTETETETEAAAAAAAAAVSPWTGLYLDALVVIAQLLAGATAATEPSAEDKRALASATIPAPAPESTPAASALSSVHSCVRGAMLAEHFLPLATRLLASSYWQRYKSEQQQVKAGAQQRAEANGKAPPPSPSLPIGLDPLTPPLPVELAPVLLQTLGNMCYYHPPTQTQCLECSSGESGGGLYMDILPLVLNHCRMDEKRPLLREWALWCVRNLCHGNEAVQKEIASFQVQAMAPNEELTKMGLEAELEMPAASTVTEEDSQSTGTAAAKARVKIKRKPKGGQ